VGDHDVRAGDPSCDLRQATYRWVVVIMGAIFVLVMVLGFLRYLAQW
jgi:hypothetical protein